jgi:rod shape-determining protein MreC
MTSFLRTRALGLTSIALFIASVQLTGISSKKPEVARAGGNVIAGLMFPIQRFFHEVSASGHYMWSRYVWLVGVQAESEQLRTRVRELESLNSRYVEFRHENDRIKNLLDFSRSTGHRGVAATVVSKDPSNWVDTITIDKGSADGIRPGLPVIDGNAIVGQTTVVTTRSAQILLISDPASAADAIVQSSRLSGVIEGAGDGKLRLRYVEQTPQEIVHPGDRIVASGLDAVYPKGVVIGVVQEVAAGSSALFQEIVVEPSAPLKRLETVLVLLPELRKHTQGLERIFGRLQIEEPEHQGGQCSQLSGES